MTEYLVRATAWLVKVAVRIHERKWGFLGIFAIVFFGSIAVLGLFGLLPEASHTSITNSTPVATSTPVIIAAEDPVKIEVAKVGLLATIANPTTTDADVLDAHLLKGAVRYPTSARLGEKGNVVLFGHSSYLPVVGNQAYKTFNGIQKLIAGDVITVSSANIAYMYRVRSVLKESAAGNAGINLAVKERVLTLATCNSFGAKSDRFIVTADFVESHSILF